MDFDASIEPRLAITACTVAKDGTVSVDDDTVELMLNPSSYNHTKSIRYSTSDAQGQPAALPSFESMGEDTVSFDFVVDGTGVTEGSPQPVKEQLDALDRIVYRYDGSEHEPQVVRLLWGSLLFFCRLKTMDTEYTLFKPNGDPLRARVKLAFVGFTSIEEMKRRANKSSPDLSHLIVVEAGDTLPLLCERVYKDGSYYIEVARHNRLTDFRHLEPGMRLEFPPLGSD